MDQKLRAVPEHILCYRFKGYVTFNYAKGLLIINAFISAQSVGIVSSLKRAATCIKGGETKRKCMTLIVMFR